MVIKTRSKIKLASWVCAFCALLAAIFGLLTADRSFSAVKAEADNLSVTEIDRVETMNGVSLMLFLTETDYMTATEWGTDSDEAYKWVESLEYADRENHNVHNARLDKNLSEYNFSEKVLINGEPIVMEQITLHANRYTRVDTLALDFSSEAALAQVEEITFKAGCQLPTLTYSYFGEGEFSCLTLEEEYIFRQHNGVWVRAYPFEGYKAGEIYDASESFFYPRSEDSVYMGHKEAATTGFTTIFADNGWMQETGYSLYSEIARKNDLVVLEFVNPINAEEFAAIELNVFSNVPRSFATYNAYNVTTASVGEELQTFSLPGRTAISFTKITLLSALYANEKGMVDTIVFRVLDDGSDNLQDNCFYVGAFSCARLRFVYNDSLFITEQNDAYDLTFRFNAKGEFSGTEKLDPSKVFVNGESVADINRNANYATAEWESFHGIYQIHVRMRKDYDGAAQIRNADNGFIGNTMMVEEGVRLPNGEEVDRSYTCRIYPEEGIVDYEIVENYEDIRVTGVSVRLDSVGQKDPNMHFLIVFDKKITEQTYVHASQSEPWRAAALAEWANYYDKEMSAAFIASGCKSSLFDSLFINGKSVGEYQASDSVNTCILAHYGQTDRYTLDLSIDCRADMFADIYAAFNAGTDITLEIKEGMKFTTGRKTSQDFSCVFNGYAVTMEGEKPEMQVFFDGKKVENGGVLLSTVKVTQDNLYVSGVAEYSVKTSVNGTTTTFVITDNEGKTFTFAVQEEIANELPKQKGCASSASIGGVATMLALFAAVLAVRRKNDE